jgi:hypothetical protein
MGYYDIIKTTPGGTVKKPKPKPKNKNGKSRILRKEI